MARQPMVTRTIKTTTANVLCIDTVNAEPYNEMIVLPRTYKDEKAMMKYISKTYDNENRKAVKVVETVVAEKLYGMSEEKFIEYADEMPARTKVEKEN